MENNKLIKKMENECGILLIAFGYDYQNITPFCISSIRKFTDLPIIVHVNTPLHIINKDICKFKNIELIYHNLNDDDNRILKTDLINYTKFKKTMYLDVDSFVLSSDFLNEFDELDKFDIISPFWKEYSIIDLEKVVNKHRKFGKFIQALDENEIEKTKRHTLIAGGVCYFNNNNSVFSFFKEYKEKYIEYNIPQDMPSLNFAYIKNKNKFKILDNTLYNNTNSKIIKSLHSSLLMDNNLINVNFSRKRSDPITNEIKFVKQGTDKLYKKPKICLIYDIEGWAYHNKSLAIKKYLNEYYDIDLLKYNKHAKNSDYDKYDIIVTYTPGNLPKNINLEKVICGVSSHIKVDSKINRLQTIKYVFSNDYIIYNQIKNAFKYKNVYYTPNGVDCNFFKTDKIKNLNNKNEITIATVGSKKREEHKGKFRVEKICENLNKLGYNIKNSSLFVDVKNEKLTPENMIDYYENIDIFLVSSVSEATPNTLLEAMSMGIPCVSNDTGMASLLIENDKTGYITDSYDNLDLYEKYIIKILENPILYKNMSINSLKKIKEYDWSKMSLFYKEMFDDFLKNSKNEKVKKDWWIKKTNTINFNKSMSTNNKKDYKIVFSLISKKENIDNLNYIVPNILNQCDFLYINMINHNLLSKSSKKYSFLNNDKIILTSFKEDNFESYFSQYENHSKDSYYFLLDDNTKYPYNYSKVMIENMVKHDNKFIICNSGFNLNSQFYDMDNKTEGFEVSSPNIINSCFYVGNFELNIKSLKEINLYNQYDYFQNNKGVKSMMLDKIRLWLKFYKK
jgi:glycosyltransferase involved in cell wall biosynthesis